MLCKPTVPPMQTLAERINQVRAEADALIEDRAALVKAENPALPLESIRMMITADSGCLCQQALKFLSEKE